jgi:hypothetical protein
MSFQVVRMQRAARRVQALLVRTNHQKLQTKYVREAKLTKISTKATKQTQIVDRDLHINGRSLVCATRKHSNNTGTNHTYNLKINTSQHTHFLMQFLVRGDLLVIFPMPLSRLVQEQYRAFLKICVTTCAHMRQ